ncbi:TetR/AcrR family transcriptional regulator [Rufibacter psychrotolerans]|uniref:TetR/AcrR family transcriptional regulator n=1 Tax=Rufibacter psychrotolerans TaxID=2812556 RepID=UPI0019684185|nr:TetR/AcrR family transcriptional regulator [Rufibacter sp. SYSU D00308]
MGFKETILDEALLIFERKGIAAITTQALLEALDISRGTLHEIAGSRKDLVQRCIAHSLRARRAAADQIVAEAEGPLEGVLQLLHLCGEEMYSLSPAFVRDLQAEHPFSWARLQAFLRLLEREYLVPLLAQCAEEGYLRPGFPPRVTGRLLLHQLQALLPPKLFHPLKYTYPELFTLMIVCYLRGAATPRGLAHLEAFSCKPLPV